MRVIDNGRGHVFGKVTQLIPEMGWIMAFLVYWGYAKPSPLVIVIVGSIMFGLVWFFGWGYTYLKIDIVQQLVTRDRDIIVRETHSMCKIMFKEKGFDFEKDIKGEKNG